MLKMPTAMPLANPVAPHQCARWHGRAQCIEQRRASGESAEEEPSPTLQRLSFIFIIIDFSLLTHFCFPLIQPAEEEPSPTLSTFSIQPSRKKKSSPNFSSLQFNPAERRTKPHRLSHSFDSTQKKKNLDSIDSGEIDIPKNKRLIISSFC